MPLQERRGRLSKPFVAFTVIIIVKTLLLWSVVFRETGGAWWQAVATGLPPVLFLFFLIESFLYRRKLGAYLTVNLLVTALYFAVIMYYKYFGVIVTYHELRQVNQVSEVNSSVVSLLDPYFLFIFADIVALILLLAVSRRFRAWSRGLSVRSSRSLAAAGQVAALVVSAVLIVPYRDGMNEFQQARDMGLVNYEAYAAFASSKDVSIGGQPVTPAAVAAAKGAQNPETTPAAGHSALWGAAKGKNLIVIQLEAFQNFLIGLQLDGTEITPNMNKLASESLYLPGFYQQVGQGNTADAEYVVNTSLFVPPNGAASEVYADKQLPGMPRTLAEAGYRTATFHTNDVLFWNRDQLYRALGWGTYYDKSFFGDDDPVAFAASDEVLYRKTADELAAFRKDGQPFYAQIISMSGHHPFRIPEAKFRMKLPDRYKGTLVGDYIQAQNYADYALGQFIAELKASGVWEDSVVVLYGDHQGLPKFSLNGKEKALMKEIYGRDYGLTDMMNIPLVVSVPGVQAQRLDQIGGQSDIYPTAAGLLGIPLDNRVVFGRDLLNDGGPALLPERYYLPSGSLITPGGAFVPGSGYADGTVYPLDGGPAGKSAVSQEAYDRARKLVSLSDSYVAGLPEWAAARPGA